ncbi:prolyl oligopeptidase family serine peptidase [Streptomyces sp. NPDC096153]|uniref:S9 family peptidase n=1 Tax=Streptomyces sp. NPDC096153 TaxID=3155548 RepID=UPI00332711C4
MAFIVDDGDGPPQLDLLWLESGERRRLTGFRRGVRDFDWAPDGQWLALLAEDEDSPYEVATCSEEGSSLGDSSEPCCRVIEHGDWRRDGEGLRLHPRHVHRVSVSACPGESERLTSGRWSLARPRVGRDGAVFVLADLREDADIAPCPQVYKLAVTSRGELEPATFLAGGVRRYHLADDGSITVIGHAVASPKADEPLMAFRVTLDGVHTLLLVELADERWVGDLGGESDLHDWWTEPEDSGDITTMSVDGETLPVRLSTGVVLARGCQTSSVAEHQAKAAAVLIRGHEPGAPEVFALEPSGVRRLTHHGSQWLDRYELPEVERLTVPGPGGDIVVYLVHPLRSCKEPAPLVLNLHGGPTAQWGGPPTLEAMVLASAGYRVAMPNLRGSVDQGRHWASSLHGAWGTVDAADAHAVLDYLIDIGVAQAGRIGVCGLSYGGFLASWLAVTSDRFAAAVTENGVSNQLTAWGACDTGPLYAEAAGLGDPTSDEGAARLWASSPLRHVTRLRCPLLILQGEDDLRCPPADNEQMFVALRRLRREVAYVIYPESDHLMQGTARLDRRIDRHRRVLEWFRRYMPPYLPS